MSFCLYKIFLHREYFRLLLRSIASNNSLFCGAENRRTAVHNTALLHQFYYVGQCIALSLLYGGPGPHFFCETTANYLLGLPYPSPSDVSNDVPDYDIVQKINQVICDLLAIYHYNTIETFPVGNYSSNC